MGSRCGRCRWPSGGRVVPLNDLTNTPGQHAVYRRPTDAQDLRRSGFVAVDQFQDIFQVAGPDFFKRHEAGVPVWAGRLQAYGLGQVHITDNLALSHHASVPDHVFQFPHISRPRVSGQENLGASRNPVEFFAVFR